MSEDIEMIENEEGLSTRDYMKKMRKKHYEEQKLKAKQQRKQEKEKKRAEKMRLRDERDQVLMDMIKKGDEIESSSELTTSN